MKPFDLQKALAGDPVITRDGVPVTEIHHFKTRNDEFNVIGVYKGIFRSFKEDGKFGLNSDSIMDLLMAETAEPETWINVYYSKIQDKIWNSVKYNSEEEAKENIVTTMSSYLTTVQIS
jgi:tellurite resistance-related uncharacterized protein